MLEKVLLSVSITFATNLLLGTSPQWVYPATEAPPSQQATAQPSPRTSDSAANQSNFWGNLVQAKALGS